MAEQSTSSSSYNNPFFQTRSSTKTKVIKLRHTWTIHNFSFCREKTGECLISPIFSASKNQWNDKLEWQLELYPEGEDEDSSKYVLVFLYLVTTNLQKIQTRFKLGIVESNAQYITRIKNLRNTSKIFSKRRFNSRSDCSKFLKKDLINNKNIFLVDDKLTVYCQITAKVGIENISETLITSKSDISNVSQVNKYYEKEYNDPTFKSTSSTLIKIVNFRYICTINNFGSTSEENGEELISPTFSAGENPWNDKSEWCLWLYPSGTNIEERSEYMSLFLVLKNNTCLVTDIQAKFKLGIVNADGNDVKKFDDRSRFSKYCKYVGTRQFIKRNDLYNQENKFIVDNKLTIFCDITATASSDNTSEILTTQQRHLTNGIAFLLGKKELSDITLCAGRKEVPAHKVVLAVHSIIFKAAFRHKEIKVYLFPITELDEESCYEMLRYMYTGEIHKLKEMAPRLLGVTVKYKMNGLKLMCEKALFESLSIENAAEILILSDTVCATELKNRVKTFIRANFVQVVSTAGFQNMIRTHPRLVILP